MLKYDIALAIKFPGERAYQNMLRRYDKKKIRWLTRELKRMIRGQKSLANELAKAQVFQMGAQTPLAAINQLGLNSSEAAQLGVRGANLIG
jgi:hypothetical protein